MKLTLKPDLLAYLRNTYSFATEHQDDTCSGGTGFLDQVMSWLAAPPMYSVLRVNTFLSTVSEVQKQLQDAISKQCEERCSPTLSVTRHISVSDVLTIAHSGPHSRSQEAVRVIVGVACGMAVLRGADVYAQGVLAAPADMRRGCRVSVYADCEGACLRGYLKQYTGQTVHVGNGRALMSRQDLFSNGDTHPCGVAVVMDECIYGAPSLSGLLPQLVFPQNLASVLAVHALAPCAGHRVLDMCAAPGGKTTHIAALMRDTGQVFALDKSKSKVRHIERNVSAWGLSCVKTFHFDATLALSDTADVDSQQPPFASGSFDRVLVDAPCSALGQRPCVRNNITLAEVKSFPPLQRRILTNAVALLKPGGTLVYSTCTLPLEENEFQVKWLLNTFPCLSIQPACPGAPPGLPGAGLTNHELHCLARFNGPLREADDAITDTIGFFCTKFNKNV